MDAHHFDKSVKKEIAASVQADAFYHSAPFSVKEIIRFNNNSEEHLKIQRQDIDLQLNFEDGRGYKVSEKFREHDYNDLLLEIYSKYPNTNGWIHKSAAERLAYFFPTRMFWIDKKALCNFCIEKLFPLVEDVAMERLLSQEANSLKVGLCINGKLYHCILTQAFNNTGGDKWNTISISVPFRMLADNNVRCQQYAFINR